VDASPHLLPQILMIAAAVTALTAVLVSGPWRALARLRLCSLGLCLLFATPLVLHALQGAGFRSPLPFTYEALNAIRAALDPWVDELAARHSRIAHDWGLWSWIAFVWAAGALWLLSRQLLGHWLLARMARRGDPIRDPRWSAALEALQPPSGLRLVASREIQGPLTWGWRRPVILVDPTTLERGASAEAVLRHELAHVLYRDWLVHSLVAALAGVFWFIPGLSQIRRKLLLAQEQRADEAAADAIGRTAYADELLALAVRPAKPCLALAMTGRRTDLRMRIEALLAPPSAGGRVHQSVAAALLTAAWLVLIGTATPPPSTASAMGTAALKRLAPVAAVQS